MLSLVDTLAAKFSRQHVEIIRHGSFNFRA